MDLLFLVLVIFLGALATSLSKKPESRARSTRTSRSFPRSNHVYKQSPIIEPSHDFHSPIGNTGSDHVDIVGRKRVSHPQPKEGHVVLNGIERRLEDCKWL